MIRTGIHLCRRIINMVADTLTLTPERGRDDHISVAALFVVLDSGRPRASTRHLLRGVERAILGRERDPLAARADATLRLGLPDPHLSVEHAVVERSLGGWQVRDLGSKTGLSVNGARLAHKVLEDGERIEIGEPFLRIRPLKVSPSSDCLR